MGKITKDTLLGVGLFYMIVRFSCETAPGYARPDINCLQDFTYFSKPRLHSCLYKLHPVVSKETPVFITMPRPVGQP